MKDLPISYIFSLPTVTYIFKATGKKFSSMKTKGARVATL